MTVKELIGKLMQLDQEMEVVVADDFEDIILLPSDVDVENQGDYYPRCRLT